MKPVEKLLDALRASGRVVKRNGAWHVTTCPAHDDKHASLGVKEDPATRKGIIKCFAGCPNEKVLEALGLGVRDLFPEDDDPGASPRLREKLTLAKLAEAKRLPVDFLKELGLRDVTGGVMIPYMDADGANMRPRLRIALDGERRFCWSRAMGKGGKSLPMVPYGLWRLQEAREGGVLYIVEGESDSWTLWYHGFHALGLPGADTTRLLQAEHVAEIPRVYIVKEPDQGGTTFVTGLAARLKEIGWPGEAFVIECGVKDVSDIHLSVDGDAEAFKNAMKTIVEVAQPLSLPTLGSEPAPAEWPELKPLEDEEDGPVLDLDNCFAPVPRLRDYVAAVAESYQVDASMPAMLSLSVLGLSISRAVEVQLAPDWRQHAPIWTCNVALPGERKSAIFTEVTQPIFDHEKARDEALHDVLVEYAAQTRMLQKRVEMLRGMHAKDADPGIERELLRLEVELGRREDFHTPRLLAMDSTPEAIAAALQRNGERLGVISAEASALENALGRYSDHPNLDVLLAGHEGDTYMFCRRKGDDFILNRPALTMALSIQPYAAKALMEHEAAVGRGLFARFLYSRPATLKGHRNLAPQPVPDHLREWWAVCLSQLLALPYPGEVCREGGIVMRRQCEPRILTLDLDAERMFLEFRAEIERELCPADGELSGTIGWADKLPGAIGRIGLALQMAKDPEAATISLEAMRAAVAWAQYLIPAFHHAVATVSLDPVHQQARLVVGWVRRQRLTEFTHREACRRNRSKSFKTNDEWAPVYNLLVERHYLKPAMTTTPGDVGGRPSVGYAVNPRVLDMAG